MSRTLLQKIVWKHRANASPKHIRPSAYLMSDQMQDLMSLFMPGKFIISQGQNNHIFGALCSYEHIVKHKHMEDAISPSGVYENTFELPKLVNLQIQNQINYKHTLLKHQDVMKNLIETVVPFVDQCVEITGDIHIFSMAERLAISHALYKMGINCIFPCDYITINWVKQKTGYWTMEMQPDFNASYDTTIKFVVSNEKMMANAC